MAVIGWIEESEVTALLKAVLMDHHMDLEAADSTVIITQRTEHAYQEVRTRLVGRGYTAAQIDTWARREEYQRDIAVWYCIQDKRFRLNDEQDWSVFYNRVEELDTLELIDDDGALIVPGGAVNLPFKIFNLEDINDDQDIDPP